MKDKHSYCTWQKYTHRGCSWWQTDCGWHPTPRDVGLTHCPACGRRIYMHMEPKESEK